MRIQATVVGLSLGVVALGGCSGGNTAAPTLPQVTGAPTTSGAVTGADPGAPGQTDQQAVAASPVAAPAVLTPYVLSAAVLGSGYTPVAETGAATLAGSHTASICGKPVAGADLSRAGRYSVLFAGTSTKPSLVEQIIRFSTATAAAQASQSIRAAVAACTPAGTATVTALAGIPASTITVREVPAVPHGLPSALAKRRTAVGQYLAFQPHGATLVGVFTSGGTDDAQTVLLRHALDALATVR